jgi:hypothetical protein
VAITSPVGKLSVNETPVKAVVGLGLLIVNTRGVVPLIGSGRGLIVNTFVIDGGDTTSKEAEAVLPVPPLVEVTGSLVFGYVPPADAVTLTTTVHEPPMASVPPESVIESDVLVTVPPH